MTLFLRQFPFRGQFSLFRQLQVFSGELWLFSGVVGFETLALCPLMMVDMLDMQL